MFAAFVAQAVYDVAVAEESEPLLAGGLLLQALEVGVSDGDGFAASLADQLAGLVPHGFITCDAVAAVDATGNTCVVQMFYGSVHCGPTDGFVYFLDAREQFFRAYLSLIAHENFEDQQALLCQFEVVEFQVLLE